MIRKLFGGMMCTAMLCLILCTAVMANWERYGDGAFAYCTELRNVTVPFGTKAIGKNAFCNCANMSRAELPSSLTEIGAYVFLLCPGQVFRRDRLLDVEQDEEDQDKEVKISKAVTIPCKWRDRQSLLPEDSDP